MLTRLFGAEPAGLSCDRGGTLNARTGVKEVSCSRMYCRSRAFTMPEPAVMVNVIEDAAGVHLTELP
jgi:hypothetical protein